MYITTTKVCVINDVTDNLDSSTITVETVWNKGSNQLAGREAIGRDSILRLRIISDDKDGGRWLANVELRRSNLGTPVEFRCTHVVLGGVPEGGIVTGINPHSAVVAPA